MIGSTELVKIDGTLIEPLRSFEVEPNKLWTDEQRTMSGKLKATFIGIFPKLFLEIGYSNATQMQTLRALFDKPEVTVEYYDEKKGTIVTAQYYVSNYKYGVFIKQRGLYSPFTVNLIPIDKEV